MNRFIVKLILHKYVDVKGETLGQRISEPEILTISGPKDKESAAKRATKILDLRGKGNYYVSNVSDVIPA